MASLDDVYRKFGEAAEAAQLLETELGTLALFEEAMKADLIQVKDPDRAAEILFKINKSTLGRLLHDVGKSRSSLDPLKNQLESALVARNKLMHSFYRGHNFRRNSEDGRALMLADLEAIHTEILTAYVEVLKLSGFDPEKAEIDLPDTHLKL